MLDRRGIVLIRDRIGSCPRLSTEHRRHTQRCSGQAVLPRLINPLRISASSRDIGVDQFRAELIINRCFTHAATP